MSQNNPIRLFVTHAWETSDEYLRIFEYLESARNFFYKNLSAPDKAPARRQGSRPRRAAPPDRAGRVRDRASGFVPPDTASCCCSS